MTPAEESYAAAWLKEMWAPCREYVAPVDPRQQGVKRRVEKVAIASTERKSA